MALSVHGFLCFMSQLQYRNENQNFVSNFVFQFIKKMKWHFGYTDCLLGLKYSHEERIKGKINWWKTFLEPKEYEVEYEKILKR